jgi:phosphoglycerate dehydrogenase-like enzyme
MQSTSLPKPAETKIVLCVKFSFDLWSIPAFLPAAIRARWPAMRVVHVEDYALLGNEIRDADIFVGFLLTPGQLAAAKKLRWIHVTAAGVSQLMRPDVQARGIVITNSRGVHAIPMAEHTIGMMVALAHKFPASMRAQMERKWAQVELWETPPRPSELYERILLLVGFGAVGREIAKYVKPFGMHVWAVTHSGRADSDLAERVFAPKDLDRALSEADYAVIAAPETPETRAMIGERQLAAMEPSAFLINMSRGSLVVEQALVNALKTRRIAGAALDVTEREPLPPESPLWDLENVFITPHISAATEQLWERQKELLLENLEKWFAGRELLNLVEVERGY